MDYDFREFKRPQYNDGDDPFVSLKISDLVGGFVDLDWKTFRIIVSEGISEEKEAIETVSTRLIREDCYFYNYTSIWRVVKKLVNTNMFKSVEINTGYRIFNILVLTTIGTIAYMEKFKKNPAKAEHERIMANHGSILHGYMIKDVKSILEKLGYANVTIERKENCIKLFDDRQIIPDVIGRKNGTVQFFEVECGNHNQGDFNDKCDRLKAITRNINIVAKNRYDAKTKLLPQIESWVRKRRDILIMNDVKVYLTTMKDLSKQKRTYIFDPNLDKPICCFERRKKEV
ncbi:MAG: hypothetical protein J5659_07820 [Clostridia bacterium]|nr:hypothetical protein [Clostridia bacterium]